MESKCVGFFLREIPTVTQSVERSLHQPINKSEVVPRLAVFVMGNVNTLKSSSSRLEVKRTMKTQSIKPINAGGEVNIRVCQGALEQAIKTLVTQLKGEGLFLHPICLASPLPFAPACVWFAFLCGAHQNL